MALEKLRFASDYMEGAHESIMEKLVKTNRVKTGGYGEDEYCDSAKQKIRAACGANDAEIYFLVGGTQTNATVLDALLKSYQGVIAAGSGHINVHEAGAIELNGHKVIALGAVNGKLTAENVDACFNAYWQDVTHEHMVMPGAVYLSQPTEVGTLYSLKELEAISALCRKFGAYLYVDGARLAYALGCRENDVMLRDMARLCDAFYIGGTKCGALFGEAVVFPRPNTAPHFFSIMKQHGSVLAKGRLLGIQFDCLFTDGLYEKLGRHAVDCADRVRQALIQKGYTLTFPSPTNQVFVTLDGEKLKKLSENVEPDIWQYIDENHCIARIATSWATDEKEIDRLIECL
ncbi:MAG: low specificity L-threonine aldolase [Clostridia bacterium]|nr:low specificity L-threonine aldolase [Clostridia bacterium]